ncbi:MAG: hypothetical protein ACRC1W_05120 [Shewanella sp.]
MSNDERISKNKKRYFTLNYGNLTEQNLKELVQGFARSKIVVAETISSNRARKVNGELQKTAQFVFENGQSVTIAVGEQGDVLSTKLNAKVVPINDLSTITAYSKEVAALVVANEPRYEKVLARKAKAAIKDASSVKPASRSIATRIEEAKSTLAQAEKNLSAAKEEQELASTVKGMADGVAGGIAKEIEALRKVESKLMKEIEQLGGEY